MNVPAEQELGEWLQRSDVPLEARMGRAWEVVEAERDPSEVARAVVWWAYREMEMAENGKGKIEDGRLAEMAPLLERAVGLNASEADDFLRARWRVSLLMALGYTAIYSGEWADWIDRVRVALAGLSDLSLLQLNPSAGVNVCRGLALLAALSRGEPAEAGVAIADCQVAFRFMASNMVLTGSHPCSGYELVTAAKAVYISVALAPHCGQAHQGKVYSFAEILALDDSWPFRGALQRTLTGDGGNG
jgi:hypothetical protein